VHPLPDAAGRAGEINHAVPTLYSGTSDLNKGISTEKGERDVHSILTTDGYKFSMAQAGFPLRRETFYLSFRKGGWQYVPFDLETAVKDMLPGAAPDDEKAYLDGYGYGLSGAMTRAAALEVEVKAAPAGTWVYEREPILTVTGPSFLVSWLEPLVLRLFFPIQLATLLTGGSTGHEELPPASPGLGRKG